MRSFYSKEPGPLTKYKPIPIIVEKCKLSSGANLKKSRVAYSPNFIYHLNGDEVSKKAYESILDASDKKYHTLKKLTRVFYIEENQIRIDNFLEPRFGLTIVRANDPRYIPSEIYIGVEIANDPDSIFMKDNVEASIQQFITESIFPGSQ